MTKVVGGTWLYLQPDSSPPDKRWTQLADGTWIAKPDVVPEPPPPVTPHRSPVVKPVKQQSPTPTPKSRANFKFPRRRAP